MYKAQDHWLSPNLNMEMSIACYGDYGRPLLFFPTAAADYLEHERFLMIDFLEPVIEAGKIRVFSIGGINREAWLNKNCHPKVKGMLQNGFNRYVAQEVVPYIWHKCQGDHGIITVGASLGAFHAANQLFRRPDLFAGTIAMSGGYDIRDYYESYGYHDENIYFNNPAEYLPNLWDDHYLPMLQNKRHIYILSGQGDYEKPDASRWLSGVLSSKGIPHKLDLWGYDMPHDWPTWRAMMPHYVGAYL